MTQSITAQEAPGPREAVEPLTDEQITEAIRQAGGCFAHAKAAIATLSERDAQIAVLVEALRYLLERCNHRPQYHDRLGPPALDRQGWQERKALEMAETALSNLPTAARALLDRVEKLTEENRVLEKERRTPGTVEVCVKCHARENERKLCARDDCTIRASAPSAAPTLEEKIKASVAEVKAMSPEERDAMHKAQRESWGRQDLD